LSLTAADSAAPTDHTVDDVGWLCVNETLVDPLISTPPPTTTFPAGHEAVAVFGLVEFVAVAVPVICW
jgi:hypothetical protein